MRRRIGSIRVFTVMCVTVCMIWNGSRSRYYVWCSSGKRIAFISLFFLDWDSGKKFFTRAWVRFLLELDGKEKTVRQSQGVKRKWQMLRHGQTKEGRRWKGGSRWMWCWHSKPKCQQATWSEQKSRGKGCALGFATESFWAMGSTVRCPVSPQGVSVVNPFIQLIKQPV